MKPLYANPVLSLLAAIIMYDMFKDYKIYDEVFIILSSLNEMLHHLQIIQKKLKLPFFQVMFKDSLAGNIQRATSFNN